MKITKALLIETAKSHRYKRLSIRCVHLVLLLIDIFIDQPNNVTKRLNEERSGSQMNLGTNERTKPKWKRWIKIQFSWFPRNSVIFSSLRSLDRILCISFEWTVDSRMWIYANGLVSRLVNRATHSIALNRFIIPK